MSTERVIGAAVGAGFAIVALAYGIAIGCMLRAGKRAARLREASIQYGNTGAVLEGEHTPGTPVFSTLPSTPDVPSTPNVPTTLNVPTTCNVPTTPNQNVPTTPDVPSTKGEPQQETPLRV